MRFATAVPVAAGATGRVVRAFDHQRGEEVALKLLHRDDPVWVQRMLREAEVQMRLDHPCICPVYGTGRLGDQPYIAMRFVDGQTLDRAATGLPDRDKAALVAKVADALAHAHHRGVVHRDLKPSNILVERHADGQLHPVVVDFGLVHDVDAPELTRTGQVLGTPGYMAPEQVTAAARVDGRADIYSLGVVLFELLSGRRPFVGESAAEILVQTLRAQPPSLPSLRPDIDPALARIVSQCMEADPAWRYADAGSLREDLVAFGEGRRVNARRDSHWRRLHRFSRRHPWRAGLGGAAAVLMATLVAVGAHSVFYAREQSARAQQYMEFAAGIEHAMRLELMKPAHDVAAVRDRLRRRVQVFAAALPASGPAAQRTGQFALGRALAMFGEHEAARVHLERAWQAGEDSPELHATLGRTLMRLYFDSLQVAASIADAELRDREIAALDREYRIGAREHLHGGARGDAARALQMQGLLAWLDGDPATAEQMLVDASTQLAFPVDALVLAGDLAAADGLGAGLDGDTSRALLRWRSALERYREATEIARSHAAAFAAQCRVGGSLVTLFRHGAAVEETEFRQALSACDRATSMDSGSAVAHASKAQAQADLGLLLRQRGSWSDADFEPAVAAARRALELAPDSLAAQRALGALLTQRAYWQAEHGDAESAETAAAAVAVLESAQRADAQSANGAVLLSNAHLAAARGAVLRLQDGEPHMIAAERVLEAVATHQNAPLVLAVQVVEIKTWRGFEAYMAGRHPGTALHDAVAHAERLFARAPAHPQVAPALGMAAWTLADFQRMSGVGAEATAQRAVDAYSAVVARPEAGFADLFNAVGALQLLARERLAGGHSAAAELELLGQWTARLRARAGDDNPIDIQLAANQHLAALEAAHGGRDPLPAFAAARQSMQRSLGNPIDRREAALMLAELIADEHEWRRLHAAADASRAAADERALEQVVHGPAAFPALEAAVARALLALPATPERAQRARGLLTGALERVPLLRGAYAGLAERMGDAGVSGGGALPAH